MPIAALKDERKKRQALERVAAENAQQAAYYRGLAEGSKGTIQQEPPANQKPVAPKKPDLNDFTDIDLFDKAKDEYDSKKDDYIKDLAKWEIRQEYQTVEQTRRETQSREETIGKYRERLATASITDAELPTIANVIGGLMPPQMQEVIINSEAAPELLRFFYENKAELERIRKIPGINLIKEMGKIEGKLLNPTQTQTRKVTQAPTPIETVKLNGTGIVSVDEEKISTDEWIKKERERRRAGRK